MQTLAADTEWEEGRQRLLIHIRQRVKQRAKIAPTTLATAYLGKIGELRQRRDLLHLTEFLHVGGEDRHLDGKIGRNLEARERLQQRIVLGEGHRRLSPSPPNGLSKRQRLS